MIRRVNFFHPPLAASRGRAARLVVLVLAVVGVVLASATPADAAATGRPGTLDRSFAGGSLIRGFGTVPGKGGAGETAPMPDGGFVVRTSRGSIGRYLADGSRDRGFGEDGYLIGVGAAHIATTADGHIYVLGYGRGTGPQLSRLLPDSSPDPSFGRRGTIELGPQTPPLEDILIAPSGAAFLVGTDFENPGVAVDALRIRPDGRVDATYGRHGLARVLYSRSGTGEDFLYALDGESLTFVANAGQFSKGSISWRNLLLGRFDSRGVIEPSFFGPIKLAGQVLERSPTGIATGSGDEVMVVAGEQFIRLSAEGALEPGTLSGEAAVGELGRGRTFSTFAIQPDGKVVIGGRTVGEGPNQLVLARLNPDGSLDPTFGGGNGVVSTGVEVGEGIPALSALTDGGLLLSGETGGHTPLLAAARFTADGALDQAFGTGGALTVPPVAYSDDKVNAVLPGPAGGVLAAGTAGGRILVADYLANGRPDPGFANRGFFLADGAGDDQGTALDRYPGGRILLGTRSPGGASLIMLGPDGQLVRSFGGDGTVALGDIDYVSALVVSRSGAILAAGSSRKPCRFLVERLGPGGGVDRRFGTSGGAARIGQDCRAENAVDMVQRPDGNLVVAIEGTRTVEELTASGRRSPRFSIDTEDAWRLPKHLGALVLDAQGRLIVGGTLFHRLGLVRLDRDGRLDRGFGRDGIVTREVGREAKVTALAVEPDGKVLASGIANACPPQLCDGPTALIARFNPDGTSDPEFGRGGVWTGRRETSALDSLAVTDEGTLLAGGWSTLHHDRNLLLVKVHR
jgi:uncharacterized delta-60 repeat protein